MSLSTRQILVTCEHGGNHVPPEYRYLFKNQQSVLNTHRGQDIGALSLAKAIASKLHVPLISSETTRLLVDLNRSLHHRQLFSEFTQNCNGEIKTNILAKYFFPYRNQVEKKIRELSASKKPVIHFSIHSFTPKLNNKVRDADIGLLYDPARKKEVKLCIQIQSLLNQNSKKLKVRRNYPYRGNADGLTTCLRKQFPESGYNGIEIEINQKLVENRKYWMVLHNTIITAILNLASPRD